MESRQESPRAAEAALPRSSSQRRLVLLLATALTALLAGALIAGWWVSANHARQFSDAEFLKRQLESLGAATDEGPAARPPALVRVAGANRRAILPTKPLYGRLVEVRKVTVSSEVTGKILQMPVEEGTLVEEGETLLASLDEVWCQMAIQQIEAEIDSIEAQLEHENRELERFRRLAQGDTITKSELDNQDSLVRQLQASLTKTQAMLQEEQERLARSKIYAPFDGTVVEKHAEVGQMLSPGSPVVDIVSRGTIDAEIRVPESLIDWVHVGLELPIVIEPLQIEAVGRVVSIIPYGLTASRTFPVRLRMDDQEGRLKVGMSVQALVPEGEQIEEIFVDKSAVLVRPDGCVAWVAMPAGSGSAGDSGQAAEQPAYQAQPVAVDIIARQKEGYAIRPETPADAAVLQPGALLIVEGAERLSAGQDVQIVTLDTRHLEHLPKASGHELSE
jgi:RND family efflux transporter MFP subunit